MVASNYEFKLVGETKDQFDLGMKLLFQHWDKEGNKAVAWKIDKDVIFLFDIKTEKDGATLFPYPLEVEEAISFVWGWLKKAKIPESDRYPDIDGSVEDNAFHLEYMHGGWSHCFAKIAKTYALYSK